MEATKSLKTNRKTFINNIDTFLTNTNLSSIEQKDLIQLINYLSDSYIKEAIVVKEYRDDVISKREMDIEIDNIIN